MAGVIKPEFPDEVVFITSRTNLSRLWFKLTPELCEFFHGALARYQEFYEVDIYGFCLMGNHYHLLARKFWGRPYKFQIVPESEDIINWFLYTILNPVSSGITTNPTALGRPNALSVIREGSNRVCRWFNRTNYENAKRKNPNVNKERYYTNHTLKISRLPGLEDLTDGQYIARIEELVRERREKILAERRSKGLGYLGEKNLRLQKAGVKPRFTKTSTRESYNPLVLSLCQKARQRVLKVYLNIADCYKVASHKFRNRMKGYVFPQNTYLPPCCIALS